MDLKNTFKVRKSLSVEGSGSTIFEIQGSQNQLFSVSETGTNTIFTVNDTSGIPVIEAFNDNTVKIGTFNDEGIIVNGSNAVAGNNFTVNSDLFVLGNTSGSNFDFAGSGSIDNTLLVKGLLTGSNLELAGSGSITNDLSVGGNLSVTGDISGTNLELTGSGSIAGNLRVGGIITAEEFHTEFVSASIIYRSGSTKFGDTNEDEHSFTGSLQVSSSADYDSYILGGNLGIGTTTPASKLTIEGDVSSSGDYYLQDLQYFTTNKYQPDFSGFGARLEAGTSGSEANTAKLTIDDLVVRKRLSVYELLINQIRATNGSVFISSTGKVYSASLETDNTYSLFFDTGSANSRFAHGFMVGDLILAQRIDPTISEGLNYDNDGRPVEVIYRSEMEVIEYLSSGSLKAILKNPSDPQAAPEEGYDYVRIGNTSSLSDRQGSVYLTADDENAPYIDVVDGVGSHDEWFNKSKAKVRMGKLDGITSTLSSFGNLSGYGFWASGSAYLEGGINATEGSIGGVEIESGKIYTGTGTWGNTNTGFYLNSEGSMSLKDKLTWDGTTLVIDGTVSASSGEIGGFNINETSIFSDNNNIVLNSDLGFISVGTGSNFEFGKGFYASDRGDLRVGDGLGNYVKYYAAENENLLSVSEDLGNTSSWRTISGSFQEFNFSGLYSPKGVPGYYYFRENSENSEHSFQSYSNNQAAIEDGKYYTVSIFAKEGNRSKFILRLESPSEFNPDANATFDLDAGTVTNNGYSATIKDYGNGWYRCSATGKADSSDGNAQIYVNLLNDSYLPIYQGDTSKGMFFFGAQIEEGTSVKSYITTDGTPVTIPSGTLDINVENFTAKGDSVEISGSNFHLLNGNITASNAFIDGIITAQGGFISGALSMSNAGAIYLGDSMLIDPDLDPYTGFSATLYEDGENFGEIILPVSESATPVANLNGTFTGYTTFTSQTGSITVEADILDLSLKITSGSTSPSLTNDTVFFQSGGLQVQVTDDEIPDVNTTWTTAYTIPVPFYRGGGFRVTDLDPDEGDFLTTTVGEVDLGRFLIPIHEVRNFRFRAHTYVRYTTSSDNPTPTFELKLENSNTTGDPLYSTYGSRTLINEEGIFVVNTPSSPPIPINGVSTVTTAGTFTTSGTTGGGGVEFTELQDRVTDLETFSSSLDNTFATDAQLTGVSSSLASTITTVSSSLASDKVNDGGGAANQLAVWSNGTTISGSTGLTFNGSVLSTTGKIDASGEITGSNFKGSNFNFTGNGTVGGGLTVGGTLKAQEFQIEYVTSTQIFESGSTKFGDSPDDVHEFTGSLEVQGSITGSLKVNSLDIDDGIIYLGNSIIKEDGSSNLSNNTHIISTIPTESYDAFFFDYVITKTANGIKHGRAGTLTAFHSASVVRFNDVSTNDFGNSEDEVDLYAEVVGGSMALKADLTTTGWTIKAIANGL